MLFFLAHVLAWNVSVIIGFFLDDEVSQGLVESTLFGSDVSGSDPPLQMAFDNNCVNQGFDSTNEVDLFARDALECLPPVNIGADTLQLFEDPFKTLKLPLSNDGKVSGSEPPSVQSSFPGSDYERFLQQMGAQGWADLDDEKKVDFDEDNPCDSKDLKGFYSHHFCCDGPALGINSFADQVASVWKYDEVDACVFSGYPCHKTCWI